LYAQEAKIDAQQFQLAFYEWVWAVNDIIAGQIINIDGKCLRGSDDQRLGKRAIYMVSAWATENELVLGQRKVDEKSNEITAILNYSKSWRFQAVLSRLTPSEPKLTSPKPLLKPRRTMC
jgi:hypothetical protein